MSTCLFATLLCVAEWIVFIFVTISIPADMLRCKEIYTGAKYRLCYSLWGMKRCGPHRSNPLNLPDKGFPPPSKRLMTLVNVGASFTIIGLATVLTNAIAFTLATCSCVSMKFPMIMAHINVAILIIGFGCLAGVWFYHTTLLDGDRIKEHFDIAYGAAILLTGWCMQVVIAVLTTIMVMKCKPLIPYQSQSPRTPTECQLVSEDRDSKLGKSGFEESL